MTRLSKADLKLRDTLAEKLREAKDKLIEAARAYNDALGEARGFIDEVQQRIAEYYDDKSEHWQEGDKGQAISFWGEEWENVDFGDVDAENLIEEDHADLLEQLPEEVQG